jgi:hypothetical protein
MNLLRNYLFVLDRNIILNTDSFIEIEYYIFRLERWQNERLTPRQLGGRLEQEDIQIQSSPKRETATRVVWLKFEAERNPSDAAYQVIRLRRKLGLPIKLPIHGPGGKQGLEQHLANARNEQVIKLKR